MATRRQYAYYAAATILAGTLGGCALVAGLFEPRPEWCSNGVVNPEKGETGIDCGGQCPTCDKGACKSDDECASLRCVAGKCERPTCLPGGEEPCAQCHRCAKGDACASNLDCGSGLCLDGVCALCDPKDSRCPGDNKRCEGGVCLEVVCNNGVMNDTTESGVDCGGACELIEKSCGSGGSGGTGTTSTTSGSGGSGGTGTTSTTGGSGGTGTTTCYDMALNCGGPCPKCEMGGHCLSPDDCIDGVCGSNNSCAPPTCTDGVKNGGEAGVDCGAPCGACDNSSCTAGSECQSGVCGGDMTCKPPACDDTVKNGTESDIDCGGTCGSNCKQLAQCKVNGDCNSGNCVDGRCRNSGCTMCSFGCGDCPNTPCAFDSTCWSGVCEMLKCM